MPLQIEAHQELTIHSLCAKRPRSFFPVAAAVALHNGENGVQDGQDGPRDKVLLVKAGAEVADPLLAAPSARRPMQAVILQESKPKLPVQFPNLQSAQGRICIFACLDQEGIVNWEITSSPSFSLLIGPIGRPSHNNRQIGPPWGSLGA